MPTRRSTRWTRSCSRAARTSTPPPTAPSRTAARPARGRSATPPRSRSPAARARAELLHATKSHHHQAVDRLGDGLVASGWSVLDDLVEAIEAPHARWALGVQWHPEVDARSGVVATLVSEAAAGVARAAAA